MPQPVQAQVHVDRFLTNMAIRYSQERDVFIADRVFPLLPVLKASDVYVKFPKSYFLRDEVRERPMGGRPPRVGFGIEKGRYSAIEWALEHGIDDRIRENADVPIDPDLRAMELLTEQMLIHRDREWAEHFFKTGVWGTDWKGSLKTAKEQEEKEVSESKFVAFNLAASTPIPFFDRRSVEMREKTGRRPNKLVLGAKTYVSLKNHPEVLERIKYTQAPPAVVTPGILASLFDVEQVLLAESIYNAAQEGQTEKKATEETQFIVNTKAAGLFYAPPAPSIQIPSAGYTFAWTGLIPGVTNAFGGVLMRGREELAHTDVLQIRATYDMQATATDLGMFFAEAVE